VRLRACTEAASAPMDHLGRPQWRELLANGFDCQDLRQGRSSHVRKSISPQVRL
jgi:hypothetical protein